MTRLQNKNLQNNLRRGGGQSIVPSNQGTNVAIPEETNLKNPFATSVNLFKSTMATIGEYVNAKAEKRELDAETKRSEVKQVALKFKDTFMRNYEKQVELGETPSEESTSWYNKLIRMTDDELVKAGEDMFVAGDNQMKAKVRLNVDKAVLDRLDKDNLKSSILSDLTPIEKSDYINLGQLPERFIETPARLEKPELKETFKKTEESKFIEDKNFIKNLNAAENKVPNIDVDIISSIRDMENNKTSTTEIRDTFIKYRNAFSGIDKINKEIEKAKFTSQKDKLSKKLEKSEILLQKLKYELQELLEGVGEEIMDPPEPPRKKSKTKSKPTRQGNESIEDFVKRTKG